ncbi:MAG: SGNH/GDSL hydrolase family protein [Pseudomonadota bacterium]|jgi:hypothetical protein
MNAVKKIVVSLIMGSVGTLAALLALEVLVRLLLPAPQRSGPGWDDRPLFYFRSPEMPGMQDYPYEVPKPPEVFRIAAIGDSFTFAPYMQFTDTYVKKLETILNVRQGGRRNQVINYGVPAYSTSHEVPVTKKALNEGADMILLQITLNDPEVKRHTPQGIRENMDDRFGPLALRGGLGWLQNNWKSFAFVARRIHNTSTHREYVKYFLDLFDNPRSWKPFVEAVQQIVTGVRDARKPIVAVVFPLFGLPLDDKYPFHPIHEKVRLLMQELGVPVLDLSAIYKGIPLERLQVIPGVDRHPNEIAHRMAAEKIYLWLEEQKLLPQEAVITEKFATRLGIDAQRVWVAPDAAAKE